MCEHVGLRATEKSCRVGIATSIRCLSPQRLLDLSLSLALALALALSSSPSLAASRWLLTREYKDEDRQNMSATGTCCQSKPQFPHQLCTARTMFRQRQAIRSKVNANIKSCLSESRVVDQEIQHGQGVGIPETPHRQSTAAQRSTA